LVGEDMKKKKWFKRLIWLGSSLVVLLAIGYFGMNIAMSYLLQSMIPEVPLEVAAITSDGSKLLDSTGRSENVSMIETPTSSSATVSSGAQAATQSDQPKTTTAPIATSKEKESTISSAAQSTSESTEAKKTDQTSTHEPEVATKEGYAYQAQVTTDKAKAVQDGITLKEKAAVTSVLVKKLSASDLQLFAKMVGNGVSIEEKKKAKEIILQKLTEDEYNQLIGIAAKYGLSQGKSYLDTQKKPSKYFIHT
jgi:cytoskeletal protein RodZ